MSPDLIETQSWLSFFRVTVRVLPEALASSGNKDVRLTPGMPATVELVTGKRSIMNYLLSPFVDQLDKALRED